MHVTENIYLIKGAGNCYIIRRENYCVLIDTATSKSAKKIIRSIKNICSGIHLDSVILTHAHYDHIAGLESVGLLLGPKIVAHKIESKYIMQLEELPKRESILGRMIDTISNLVKPPNYPVDRSIEDGEVIHDLKVHHCPGHTPGTIALLDIESETLFASDVLNNKKGMICPPSRFFSRDYKRALESSIKLLKRTTPRRIVFGHGAPISTNIERKIENYVDKTYQLLEKLK